MKYVTIHAAATFPSMDVDVATIREWHLQRGFNDVGYHYFIKRDGTVQNGRYESVTGAHVGGHNTGNIGICMAGGLKEGTKIPEDNFTQAQWTSLNRLLDDIIKRFPSIIVMGHNGFKGHETRGCPCFDWKAYRSWLVSIRKALYKPSDWYSLDWHHTSPKDFQLPKDFYQAVDKGDIYGR